MNAIFDPITKEGLDYLDKYMDDKKDLNLCLIRVVDSEIYKLDRTISLLCNVKKYSDLPDIREKLKATTVPEDYNFNKKKLYVLPGTFYSQHSIKRIVRKLGMKITNNYDLADVVLSNTNYKKADGFTTRFTFTRYFAVSLALHQGVEIPENLLKSIRNEEDKDPILFPTEFTLFNDEPDKLEKLKKEESSKFSLSTNCSYSSFKVSKLGAIKKELDYKTNQPLRKIVGSDQNIIKTIPYGMLGDAVPLGLINILADIESNKKHVIHERDFFKLGFMTELTDDLLQDILSEVELAVTKQKKLLMSEKIIPTIDYKLNVLNLIKLVTTIEKSWSRQNLVSKHADFSYWYSYVNWCHPNNPNLVSILNEEGIINSEFINKYKEKELCNLNLSNLMIFDLEFSLKESIKNNVLKNG